MELSVSEFATKTATNVGGVRDVLSGAADAHFSDRGGRMLGVVAKLMLMRSCSPNECCR